MSKLAMTEEIFWEYLSTEINSGAEEFDLISNLTEKLTKKSNEEIFSFGVIIDELMAKSYSSKLWCAAYLVNHGCTDDGFDYFRLWLISKGKETFYDVINNPDNLIKYVHLTDSVEDEKYGEFYENESIDLDWCSDGYFDLDSLCAKSRKNSGGTRSSRRTCCTDDD